MLPRRTAGVVGSLFLSLSLFSAPPARAQVFDLDKDREPMVLLDGLWRFHPGDDPRWADPNFDDSQWPLISSAKNWSEQGYKGMSGTAWYRVKIQINTYPQPLALFVPRVLTSYQVFCDGKLLGGVGQMPPHPDIPITHAAVYDLPQLRRAPQTLTIAVRVWHSPVVTGFWPGGIQGGVRVGGKQAVEALLAASVRERAWSSAGIIFLGILDLLAGLTALAFFAARRGEREYLWFGVMILLAAAWNFVTTYVRFHVVAIETRDLTLNALDTSRNVAQILFYFHLLKARRDWLFWAAISAAIMGTATDLVFVNGSTLLSVAQSNILGAFLWIPIVVWTVNLMIRRTVQRFPDARLLVAPVLLQQISAVWDSVWLAGYQMGWYPNSRFVLQNSVWDWPFPFSLNNAIDAGFLVAMQAILIFRFTRSREHEEQLSGEFEAARTVQQVLIPEAIPTIPGFEIQSFYKPFGEVGGDFFQILRTRQNGALVIIGDVSGKGMPAAMAVSLLVGTVRTLAHYTQSPGEILTAMNQRMLARSQGGFTTCLVLRIDHNGTLTAANAGHLAPYINGRELLIDNGLPLGIAEDSSYSECTAQLDHGAKLTLMTDGVAEARAPNGELFGFERAASVTVLNADQIANTAAAFGQQDDITVLTISRVAAEQESLDALASTVSPQSV